MGLSPTSRSNGSLVKLAITPDLQSGVTGSKPVCIHKKRFKEQSTSSEWGAGPTVNGPFGKGLSRCPFTAESRVQIPYGLQIRENRESADGNNYRTSIRHTLIKTPRLTEVSDCYGV